MVRVRDKCKSAYTVKIAICTSAMSRKSPLCHPKLLNIVCAEGLALQRLSFFLAVIPVVRNISEPRDTQLSEPVAIFCLVTGYPIPTITWQQDGWSLTSGTGQDARVSIFSFTSNGTSEFVSSDFVEGSGGVSISDLLLMNTDVTPDEIASLGELGVVSVLSIDSVVREDTGNYTCTACNQLPETRVINVTSSQVPLLVLGNQFICKVLSKVQCHLLQSLLRDPLPQHNFQCPLRSWMRMTAL